MHKQEVASMGAENVAQPEPWLRGTLTEVSAVPRAVLHALQLAREDLQKWCGLLTDGELNARLASLPSVAFHLRHIAGSLDRLLTYAEGGALTHEQLASVKNETSPGATREELFAALNSALIHSEERIRTLAPAELDQARVVGKKALPTTLGGLMVHIADHTQRHVGQAITTAKAIIAQRE